MAKKKEKYRIIDKKIIKGYEYGYFSDDENEDECDNCLIDSRYYLLADGWEIVACMGKYGYDHIVRRQV